MLTAEFDQTMAMIGDRPIASLVDLPALNDPEIAALQDVLQEMFSPTFSLCTNNFGITVMKVLQNSLKHGISKNSIYAYVNFGTLLCARLEIEKGLEFGRAALRLNEIHPDKKSEAMLWNMWGAFIQHWTESYPTYRASLRKAIHAGLETGQYIWSFYNTVNTTLSSLLMGRHLHDIIEESKLYMPLCRLDKFNAIMWIVGAAADLCEDLRTPDEGNGWKRTPWVDTDAIAKEARRVNNQATLYFVNIFAVIAGIFRGSYEEVAEIWGRTDPETLGMLAAWHPTPGYHFYGALAFSRASQTAAPELRETYLARLRECARKVDFWAKIGPQSFRHRDLILKAELARVEQKEGAGDLYDQGIAAARDGQFLHDGALANELCARHYLDLGRTFLARAYMTEAHRLYARWGASRAMQRLERDFPHALQPEALRRQAALVRGGYAVARDAAVDHAADEDYAAGELDVGAVIKAPSRVDTDLPNARYSHEPRPRRQRDRGAPAPTTLFDSSDSALDFVSMLKASQAVSGELGLGRVIETLLSIAVEHSGAARGLLIRPRGAEYDIEAEVVTGRDRVEVTLQNAPITPADLPTSILQYVIRTRENVILDDAAAPNLFSDDAYVRGRRPRSVLCLALVKQGKLVGVLYLENNLTPRVFTGERIAMLELLASQSAISLENAGLFAQVQQENSERKRAEVALRDREEWLRLAVEATELGTFDYYPVTQKIISSARNSEILGLPPHPDTDYKTFLSCLHPEEKQRVDQLVQQATDPSGSGRFDVEYRVLWPDGTTRWVKVKGRIFFGEMDGVRRAVRFTGTTMDITEGKQAEAAIQELNATLERRVEQRTRELQAAQQELLATARRAGMAEIATNVLHNVGNVLNSVNVRASVARDTMRASRVQRLPQLAQLLTRHEGDLASFLTQDPQGRHVPAYLRELATNLGCERAALLESLASIIKYINHIKTIVQLQQSYAGAAGMAELVCPASLLADALSINAVELNQQPIEIVQDYENIAPLNLDKHKILQILVNLISNARYALMQSGTERPRLLLRLRRVGADRIRMQVGDNGVGIPKENLTRIFQHGFTTRPGGHGFGLHSGALAAREMGGSLTVESPGPGHGATFTLEVPAYGEATERDS